MAIKRSLIFFLLLLVFKVELFPNILEHIKDGMGIFFRTHTNKESFFDQDFNQSDWLVQDKVPARSVQPIITWIGHSTFLIQISDLNIITDPVFYDLHFLYKRKMPLGIALDQLPKIDIVLISHNHKDHFCKKSLFYLKKDNPMIFTPQGTLNFFKKNKFKNVSEFKLDKYVSVGKSKLTFLKTAHWTGSNLLDFNKSLAGSWLIQNDSFKIYFTGDSSYSDHFLKIGTKYKNIDVALLPIAPNEPNKYTQGSHMSAQESVQAFLDLGAKNFIPMHWGTFTLGTDTFLGPINKLKKEFYKLSNKNLIVAKFGQQIRFNQNIKQKIER